MCPGGRAAVYQVIAPSQGTGNPGVLRGSEKPCTAIDSGFSNRKRPLIEHIFAQTDPLFNRPKYITAVFNFQYLFWDFLWVLRLSLAMGRRKWCNFPRYYEEPSWWLIRRESGGDHHFFREEVDASCVCDGGLVSASGIGPNAVCPARSRFRRGDGRRQFRQRPPAAIAGKMEAVMSAWKPAEP